MDAGTPGPASKQATHRLSLVSTPDRSLPPQTNNQVGWRVRRIPLAGVGFLEDNALNPDKVTAALVQDTALWRQLKNGKDGDVKGRMLEELRKCGWNVR